MLSHHEENTMLDRSMQYDRTHTYRRASLLHTHRVTLNLIEIDRVYK